MSGPTVYVVWNRQGRLYVPRVEFLTREDAEAWVAQQLRPRDFEVRFAHAGQQR